MTKAEHVAAAREAAEEAEILQRGQGLNYGASTSSILTLLTTAVRELVAATEEDAAPARPYVVIYPREGVDATRIKDWIQEYFQHPGDVDGVLATRYADGNPLINARIEIEGESNG